MAPADNEVTATWPNFYSRNISFAGPEVTCSTAGEGADALTGIGPTIPITGRTDSPAGEAGVATDFPGQPIDHSTGNAAEGLGALLSVPFHDQLNSAEAHENNGA